MRSTDCQTQVTDKDTERYLLDHLAIVLGVHFTPLVWYRPIFTAWLFFSLGWMQEQEAAVCTVVWKAVWLATDVVDQWPALCTHLCWAEVTGAEAVHCTTQGVREGHMEGGRRAAGRGREALVLLLSKFWSDLIWPLQEQQHGAEHKHLQEENAQFKVISLVLWLKS